MLQMSNRKHSDVSDDDDVELIVENLSQLTHLDLENQGFTPLNHLYNKGMVRVWTKQGMVFDESFDFRISNPLLLFIRILSRVNY